jgi:hypothetical protein
MFENQREKGSNVLISPVNFSFRKLRDLAILRPEKCANLPLSSTMDLYLTSLASLFKDLGLKS